jgi:hypothetical protein
MISGIKPGDHMQIPHNILRHRLRKLNYALPPLLKRGIEINKGINSLVYIIDGNNFSLSSESKVIYQNRIHVIKMSGFAGEIYVNKKTYKIKKELELKTYMKYNALLFSSR